MELCSPALIYLIFSLTQVVVDTIKGLYNVALVKFIMMILFSLLLNILCERGLGIISWIRSVEYRVLASDSSCEFVLRACFFALFPPFVFFTMIINRSMWIIYVFYF